MSAASIGVNDQLDQYCINDTIATNTAPEERLGIPIIVIGDRTNHGGTVITCSPFSDTHGKGWARVGDMVSCPRCGGVFPITQGDASLIDDGKSVAYDGCKTACGAILIASQMFTFTTPSGGGASKAADSTSHALSDGRGAISAELAGGYQDEPLDERSSRYRGRFQVVDASTGAPIAGQAVRVRSTSGQIVEGNTDADGYTQWVERDAREALALHLIQDRKA